MAKVFFEIGGNQGDRLNNLVLAKEAIIGNIGVLIKESAIFETPPWGFESDYSFYNQALLVETKLTVIQVLSRLLEIEIELGRVREATGYSSRTMDIDILFFDALILETNELIVPHPRLHLRKFVLLPLADIAPDYKHPVFNKSIAKLLDECPDNSECIRIN